MSQKRQAPDSALDHIDRERASYTSIYTHY